jgi:TrmH family RNA methyltransferase
VLARLQAPAAEEATPEVVQAACDTVTPQGVVAAFAIPAAPRLLPERGLVVILDGVRDPGNAGAILRSALAAGCAAVLATPDTCDLFGPKVVRAAMGAHARLALGADLAWPAIRELVAARRIYVAEAATGLAYDEVDWRQPAALVIGNETEGPRPEALQGAAGRVSIPMPGRAESLNAAAAASILIFEWVRQTRRATKKET